MLVQKEVLSSFIDFFTLPFKSGEMFWILIPVVLTLIIMELYYAKYRHEELGWNTATANSMVLVFVAMDLFHYLFDNGLLSFVPTSAGVGLSLLVLLVMFGGITMFVMDFGHKWPKFLAFHVSSRVSINLVAYLSILFVYTSLTLTANTLIAAILFFIAVSFFFSLLRIIYPLKQKHNQIPKKAS